VPEGIIEGRGVIKHLAGGDGLGCLAPRGAGVPGEALGVVDARPQRHDPVVDQLAGAGIGLEVLPGIGDTQKLGLEIGIRLLQ
jgi:hypothetical protein